MGLGFFASFFLVFFGYGLAEKEAAKLPFWKAKPEVYAQVVEERRVFVSVTDQTKGKTKLMGVNGGGQIRAPKDYSFSKVQDLPELFKKSSYVKKLEVDEKNQTVFVKSKAYGLWATMKIKWGTLKNEKDLSVLHFKIIGGLMSGFEGRLNFEPAVKDRTDVGIVGEYAYDQFPLPSFFLRFGLEIIFQRVAIEVRSSIEESLKNDRAKTVSQNSL